MNHLFKLVMALVAASVVSACGGAPAQVAAPQEAASVVDAGSADAQAELDLPPSIDAQTLAQVKGRDDVTVIDVREPSEFQAGHVAGAVLIPTGEVPNRLSEIPTEGTVIVMCRSGNRSSQITQFLRDQGYTNVHNLDGGILSWEAAGLPVEK
jgi:rhodanese-related sulfurtransferase